MSQILPYQDKQLSIGERVQDLLDRMTLEEKIGQMWQMPSYGEAKKWISENHVGSFLHTMGQETNDLQELAAATRLGIPLIFGIDAIHGHAFWHESTVFPTQLALSCSWNPDLIERVGGRIVLDASETGERALPAPVDARRLAVDPLGELVEAYFGAIPAVFRRPASRLGQYLLPELSDRGVQGVVVARHVWCDLWRAEVSCLRESIELPIVYRD